jgi:hypothetical protein
VSGFVLGDGLLHVLESELQLVSAELLGAATELVAHQTLNQQPELVILRCNRALLVQHRPQHLLQLGGVVGQGVGIDLHKTMMNDAAASRPAF